jgi:hypothetical protein
MISGNIYLTGLGSVGSVTAVADTFLRKLIPGKAGSRVVIENLKAQNRGAQSTQGFIVCMKALNVAPITAAGTAAGTSGVTISTANFAFGDSGKWGGATDSIAADDVVVVLQADGTYNMDMVNNVATTGYITLDSALPNLVNTNCYLYIMGTDSYEGHTKLAISGSTHDAEYKECFVGESKGDPCVITNGPVSSTGTIAAGVTLLDATYSYVNK